MIVTLTGLSGHNTNRLGLPRPIAFIVGSARLIALMVGLARLIALIGGLGRLIALTVNLKTLSQLVLFFNKHNEIFLLNSENIERNNVKLKVFKPK